MRTAGTVIDVDLDVIAANVRELRRASGMNVIAVVKGDGYGHGAEASGWAALEGGAAMLAVFSIEEAVALRRALPRADIVVLLGPLDDVDIERAFDIGAVLTVWSEQTAQAVAREARHRGVVARVQVKVDTGMTRLGVSHRDAARAYRAISSDESLRVEGIFTHLANANERIDDATIEQLERFRAVVEALDTRPPWVHVTASSVHRGASVSDICTAIRPGRALFGPGDPTVDGPVHLRSPLVWRSSVARVERVGRGTPVSYGGDHRTTTRTRIATIPVGYGHGLPRSGTTHLRLLVGGERVPVVGRVTMDSVMVDVGDRAVSRGDEVIVVGAQGEASQSLLELAEACGTIPEEVAVRIAARVPRRYWSRGQLVATKTLADGFTWC